MGKEEKDREEGGDKKWNMIGNEEGKEICGRDKWRGGKEKISSKEGNEK